MSVIHSVGDNNWARALTLQCECDFAVAMIIASLWLEWFIFYFSIYGGRNVVSRKFKITLQLSSHNRNVMLFRILGFSRGWNWLGEFWGSPRASGHGRRRVLPEVGPLSVVPGAEFGVGSDGGGGRRRRGTPVGHHGRSGAIWSAAEDAPCWKERSAIRWSLKALYVLIIPEEFVFMESTPLSWLKVLEESLGILHWTADVFFIGKSDEIGDTEERLASEGVSSRVRP